ncbi:nucleotide exchange factor GrpE [Chamaesiphon sp. VAR_48_metabat_403]|uniref:nucleotide exchange factor GrpE n=1 Tax=Chamaesiphon sp. VAR_48_metabat_403 TaxID=2964700 RepID=UPI00286E2595|nr:nucleotide exchange factor GrpE [Chamaesiphon sp. VAR_48_metabat_403]
MYQISAAERDEIIAQIDRTICENAALKAKLQQQQATTAAANNHLLVELLGLVDALDYLRIYLAENPDPPPAFRQRLPHSVRSISSKLEAILSGCGVREIPVPLDVPPNFNVCTAVSRKFRSDLPPQSAIEVTRRGFYIGDAILRSAEVIVSTTVSE